MSTPDLLVSRGSRDRGFTMVELTIVVLVILILFGLAIPRFSALTDAAKQAQCIANLRVIESAISQWENKNSKTFPQGWIPKTGIKTGKKAFDLTPYVKDASAFDCPLGDRDDGEYYYVIPANDKKKKYTKWFPSCNCYYYGRPTSLNTDHPHTTLKSDPY